MNIIAYRFGFYQQCMTNYQSEEVWEDFMKACDCLPICAIVNDSIFAVHAGISPSLTSVEEIDSIDRFQEIPLISFSIYLFWIVSFPSFHEGLFCDLLWSDPSSLNGFNPSNRGISYTYGCDASERFLMNNSLKCIIRGHELVMTVLLLLEWNTK